MKITTLSQFNNYVKKLPEHIQNDVAQRVQDGLEGGFTEKDAYIQRQFKYVSECLELLELC